PQRLHQRGIDVPAQARERSPRASGGLGASAQAQADGVVNAPSCARGAHARLPRGCADECGDAGSPGPLNVSKSGPGEVGGPSGSTQMYPDHASDQHNCLVCGYFLAPEWVSQPATRSTRTAMSSRGLPSWAAIAAFSTRAALACASAHTQ